MKVALPSYLEYYQSYTKSPYKDLKVKSKSALVRFLDITREIISSGWIDNDESLLRKLRQIKDVLGMSPQCNSLLLPSYQSPSLERWEISGINRKLQLKPQKWVTIEHPTSSNTVAVNSNTVHASSGGHMNMTMSDDLSTNRSSVISSNGVEEKACELLLILKWGGDLTPLGEFCI